MSQDKGEEHTGQNGAEPVYGPAYTGRRTAAPTQQATPFDGPAPPYTAPYPPYPSDVPYALPIPVNQAAGLAYLVAPAVVFLLLPAYRSQSLLRFHSWQAIFYFIVTVAVREIEQLLVSMLPSPVAFTLSGLVLLVLSAGWLGCTDQSATGGEVAAACDRRLRGTHGQHDQFALVAGPVPSDLPVILKRSE